MPTEAYQTAERFLLGLINYEVKPPPMRCDEEGWHLGEFARMLRVLDHPEKAAPILHIAGTKGKGSTTRLCVALLRSMGYCRVGSFISPHIAWFRQRICIDNSPISETAFVRALRAVQGHCAIGSPEGFRTTFEVLTAMGLWTWRDRGSEAVVLETGLGGRLDSTNVPVSRVAAITAIGFDHQRVLGRTLREIAGEKAGIIKPGTGGAVVGPQLPRRRRIVREVAEAHARKAGVALRVFDPSRDPVLSADARSWGFDLSLRIGASEPVAARLRGLGRHQLNNLRTALMAASAFGEADGRRLEPTRVARAIETVRFPGRCEVVSDRPAVVLDSAHCPLSARATAAVCREHFAGRPVVLVLGLLGDKNHDAILKSLTGAGDIRRVLTYTPPTPRACRAETTARRATRHFASATACDSVDDAIEDALQVVRREPETLVLVTGTFYGLEPARRALRSHIPDPDALTGGRP